MEYNILKVYLWRDAQRMGYSYHTTLVCGVHCTGGETWGELGYVGRTVGKDFLMLCHWDADAEVKVFIQAMVSC